MNGGLGLWVRGMKKKFGGDRVDLMVIDNKYLRVNGSKIIHVHGQKPYKINTVVNVRVLVQKRLRRLPVLKIVLRVNGVRGKMFLMHVECREAVETRTTRAGTTERKLGYWQVYQQRTRPVLEEAQNGGGCNKIEFRHHTLPKQNCVQTEWSGWTHQRHWNSGNNWYSRQKRTRTTTTPAAYGGSACGATSEEKDVGMAKVHCAVSGWSGWSNGYTSDVVKNSYSCKWRGGRGGSYSCKWDGPLRHYRQDKRTRSITTHPAWGGNGCPALQETRETMRTPVNCEVSGWSWWSELYENYHTAPAIRRFCMWESK